MSDSESSPSSPAGPGSPDQDEDEPTQAVARDTTSSPAAEDDDNGDEPTQAWGRADDGPEEGEDDEAPTQAFKTAVLSRGEDHSGDDDEPTQAYGKAAEESEDDNDEPTQAYGMSRFGADSGDEDMQDSTNMAEGVVEGYDPEDGHDSQSQIETQAYVPMDIEGGSKDDVTTTDAPKTHAARAGSRASLRSKSRSRSRSGSANSAKSRSRSGSESPSERKSKSRSVSRSRSKSAALRSRSQSKSVSRSRSRSKSGSRSRSVSRSKSRSRSMSRSRSPISRDRSKSRSVSRSKSASRSKSRSVSRSRSMSRSRSSSRSKSRSKSVSRSRSRSRSAGSDSDIETRKRKVVKEAFGDSDEEEKNKKDNVAALPELSDSDAEGEEKENKKEEQKQHQTAVADSSDDEGPTRDGPGDSLSGGRLMSDFDMMLERRRSEQRKRRKKKDIELINDNDDAIARLIADMRLAAREDNDLNLAKQPAVRKIGMLPNVMSQLKKVDLQMAFVEANVLSVMTDWLAPMPDKSLPSLEIRKELLKLLLTLRIDDQSRLKESGIGKAVMYLYKHPKEIRPNKELAGKIIMNWSRPIFNKSSDYKDYDKETRAERDVELLASKRRKVDEPEPEEEALRPGEPGWIARARVPLPSTKDYITRPQWQTNIEVGKSKKKEVGFLDKHMRALQERKRLAKARRAVEMSLEGRKMAL